MAGRVSGLWVYPVKSMRGHSLDVASIDVRGVEGDRLYAVRDTAGKIGSGKNTRRFARMDCVARWAARICSAGVEVRPPDGDWIDGASQTAAALLTVQVGRPVTLSREAEIQHFDAAPIHLMTTGDLAMLERFAGVRPRVESFRPNLLVETEERSGDWIGRRLRIGSVELEAIAPTERCLMVNVAPDGRPGFDFLRPVAQRMDACFGIYASVVEIGRVALCDSIELLD